MRSLSGPCPKMASRASSNQAAPSIPKSMKRCWFPTTAYHTKLSFPRNFLWNLTVSVHCAVDDDYSKLWLSVVSTDVDRHPWFDKNLFCAPFSRPNSIDYIIIGSINLIIEINAAKVGRQSPISCQSFSHRFLLSMKQERIYKVVFKLCTLLLVNCRAAE